MTMPPLSWSTVLGTFTVGAWVGALLVLLVQSRRFWHPRPWRPVLWVRRRAVRAKLVGFVTTHTACGGWE